MEPRKKTRSRDEFKVQVMVAVALEKMGVLFYASANGGSRNMLEAVNLKRSGVKKGVPDICIVEPVEPYHGLYIELKREKGGVVSPEQKWWIEQLRKRNYRAEVARGFDEAMIIVREYFKC